MLTPNIWAAAPPEADIPRFIRVDEGLYRGGEPSEEGVRWLAAHGVKTIVNLRYHYAEQSHTQQLAERLGMTWVNIPTRFWWRPNDGQVRTFLRLALDPASRPVFIHCRQGKNRTGIMVAVYRIAHDGWTPDAAYAEARRLGLHWWNVAARHLILDESEREFASGSRAGQRRISNTPTRRPPATQVGLSWR